MTRTAYDLREKRIICRPFGIDKRKSDLKCISEIHHIVKTAEFDMGVEESYEYGKCNKDNQNTGNCRVAGMEIVLNPLSLSVSCHIGPGALAVACSKKIPELLE